jgi:flavin-binding protein dodecin
MDPDHKDPATRFADVSGLRAGSKHHAGDRRRAACTLACQALSARTLFADDGGRAAFLRAHRAAGRLSRRNHMGNHVYKQIELVGSSTTSSDDAISRAIERASSTLRNIEWFEVTGVRGHIEEGRIAHWQVCLKIGMRIEEAD